MQSINFIRFFGAMVILFITANSMKKMKRLILFFLINAIIMSSASFLYADEKAPLGVGNIAIKVDYAKFTANINDDVLIYAAIEESIKLPSNFYFGLEIGSVLGISNITFIPIEANLKYSLEATSNFALNFGAGASYNYAKEDSDGYYWSYRGDDWLIGGQFFLDLNYTTDKVFIGINVKYQFTEDSEDLNFKYNNFRVGGQIGLKF